MVVIEFFSETPIDNMISTLTSHPDKVILVGQSKIIRKNGKAYEKFLVSVCIGENCHGLSGLSFRFDWRG